ncbi:MAG: trehalose-6-phosphate synthase [Acidobacteriia bacterium]|nr:trehalose-6-phosphate synthase [Terriglobia bacterium]
MGQWTRESIRQVIASKFAGRKIIAVSNREPYQHFRSNNRMDCAQPASGLITAVDPIMRASGGVWIAQGSGEADREAVDEWDHARVPPDEPAYTLRRVWLAPELSREYYYGLSNEAIWPVCHMVFRRPQFTERSWQSYRRVNEIFAEAVLQEAGGEAAVVLIQDYHFALLPRILKRHNPKLRVAQFWHIPWPDAGAVRILPWREELLQGLLGNDLLGFQLKEDCAHFFASVAQNARNALGASGGCAAADGHVTTVRAFPISIDFAEHSRRAASKDVDANMRRWLGELGPAPEIVGIGIDRVDYTKGIPERLAALDLLFQEHPEYLGRLVFVQVGVPSRTAIPEYRSLDDEIAAQVSQINGRWAMRGWKPIVFVPRQLDQQTLIALHLMADFCVVSSLHDGMNLVAKEFVGSRIDEDGVLVLSEFAGAARELTDALIVNPFCVYEIAAAMHDAITMAPQERRRRMLGMRAVVAANNVYRWGSELLAALARTDPSHGAHHDRHRERLPEPEENTYARRDAQFV